MNLVSFFQTVAFVSGQFFTQRTADACLLPTVHLNVAYIYLAEQETKLKMKANKAWHLKNRMPENATFEKRVKWHLAHQKNCNCRPIPGRLLEEMKKKKVKF